jgi:hypothetical protein
VSIRDEFDRAIDAAMLLALNGEGQPFFCRIQGTSSAFWKMENSKWR